MLLSYRLFYSTSITQEPTATAFTAARRPSTTRTYARFTSYPKLVWRRNQALQALLTTDARKPANNGTQRSCRRNEKSFQACTRPEMKRRSSRTRRTGRTRRSRARKHLLLPCTSTETSMYFHDCHVPPWVFRWRYSVLGGYFGTSKGAPAKLLVRSQFLDLHVNPKATH